MDDETPIDQVEDEVEEEEEEEDDDDGFVSTAGLPVIDYPCIGIFIDPDEEPVRLKTFSEVPVLQAILDVLPRAFLSGIPVEERSRFVRAMERTRTINALLAQILAAWKVSCMPDVNKLLVTLDTQHYHRRWVCPECGQRWGRHDPHTLECPNMSPLTRGEIGD